MQKIEPEMKEVLLVIPKEFQNNKLFDVSDPRLNRDNCLEPCYKLKARLAELGYDAKTMDMGSAQKAELILFLDLVNTKDFFRLCLRKNLRNKMALFLWEPPSVAPESYNPSYHEHFKKIFTWNDDLVDNNRYFKFFIPQPPHSTPIKESPFKSKKLITSITSNKSSKHPDELYDERLSAIKYFARRHNKDFAFYGMGWKRKRSVTEIIKELFSPSFFRCYGGTVKDKVQTMAQYKFSICYENIKGLRGYITEKIFDSFKAGCVPVYWGAENVTEYIPENCFIDRRKFSSYDKLASFLTGMKEGEYLEYQKNIKDFLSSDKFKPFTTEHFVKTIIEGVLEK